MNCSVFGMLLHKQLPDSLCGRPPVLEATLEILAKNMVLIGLSHFPNTWMTPHKPYGDK